MLHGRKMLPEVVADRIPDVMKELSQTKEIEVRTYQPPRSSSELTKDDWDLVLDDLAWATHAQLLVLKQTHRTCNNCRLCWQQLRTQKRQLRATMVRRPLIYMRKILDQKYMIPAQMR